MWCELLLWYLVLFFFFKQKTAYEMRISDWSSDVCSSDLGPEAVWVDDVDVEGVVADPDRLGRLGLAGHGDLEDAAEEVAPLAAGAVDVHRQIGRASCRERVCKYV